MVWGANAASLAPDLGPPVLPVTWDLWLKRVLLHVNQGGRQILQFLSIVRRAAAHLVDATVEVIRAGTRTVALLN